MSKKSLYDETYNFFEERKNLGLDYSDKIFKRTVSNYLYRNETVAGFLDKLNAIYLNCIESVKYLRIFHNIAVKKNYKKIN